METSDIKLLVGLGNPGKEYKSTRHNIGFMVLEKLAIKNSVNFRKNKKFQGYISEINLSNKKQTLLMPNTFMNESGRSIRSLMQWYSIKEHQLLVLVDDIDLPLGKIRLRSKGSSGGHNGLKSIIQNIGTQDFKRIKIGIGSPSGESSERKMKTNSHVLGTFSSTERLIVEKVIEGVIEGIELLQNVEWSRASTSINSYKVNKD